MNVYDVINKEALDGIIITSPINIRYLAKFTGTSAIVLILKNKNFIFVDSRYYEQALNQCDNYEVVLYKKVDLFQKINDILLKNKIEIIGFESERMVVSEYNDFSESLNCNLKAITLNQVRTVKTENELSLIKKACEITDMAYSHLLSYIKIGMSEKEVNIELQKFILENGSSGLSFDTIIASGKRGSMPHGVASDKLIEENDFITIDFGVFYNGYTSDMTRSFVVGNAPNEQLVTIYNIVKTAQEKAISAIKAGEKACNIDKIARDYITEQGYGDYFEHGLGHSIGLEVHEMPYINSSSTDVLKTGNVITVEPGIYIPGLGGIRIEDDVIVKDNGCEIINKSSKELIKIDGR
ncbi:Xaa-Pro aminopeptidase [Bacilli bacterium PM5-3]|nr:Xaa-Pro aminopeptidase [Bacilli bacterium PM5-3]MDH6603071.1 Xaa-Pro aminopeptidase [Bacilli bacterium PM5-9]